MKLTSPSVDQKKIYDTYISARASAALAVAVRLGVFETLHTNPSDHHAVAQKHELHPRGAQAILRALSAAEILVHHDGIFSLSEEAKIYLRKDSPFYLGALIDMENESFLTPQKLLESAKSGAPSVYGNADVWEAHEQDPAQAKAFTAAMHSISITPALAVAQLSIWSKISTLLDIGGGSGVLPIAITQQHPKINATIFDIPQVCSIAQEYIEQYSLSERIQTQHGDMFAGAYPKGFDGILFSQILHDWNYQQGMQLLQYAKESLQDGGWIIIHEKLTDQNHQHKPLANALVNLDMLIWTEGQQYTAMELEKFLQQIGCTKIQTIPTTGYWSVVIGWVSPQP